MLALALALVMAYLIAAIALDLRLIERTYRRLLRLLAYVTASRCLRLLLSL